MWFVLLAVTHHSYISSLYWLQQAPTQSMGDPHGLQLMLQHLKESYGDLPIYVQENGKYSFCFP